VEHLYIYYQVRPEHRNRARSLVLQIQSRLANRTGQKGRILRRPELSAAGTETWMEVYENVSQATAAIVAELQAESGLAELIVGERHVERFIDQWDVA
jgi:hypothetical protein